MIMFGVRGLFKSSARLARAAPLRLRGVPTLELLSVAGLATAVRAHGGRCTAANPQNL